MAANSQIAGGKIRVRAILAKRGYRHVNDARIGLAHGFKTDPLAVHLTGPGRFDDEVGLFRQGEQGSSAGIRVQVKTNAAFVAVEREVLEASFRLWTIFQKRPHRPA